MATLFLSDLHLAPEPSPLRAVFLRFLRGPARDARAVYLLGDLFEHWIGDDVGVQEFAPEVAALAALTAGGVPVFFQHGNRDFLVGRDFAQLTGVTLLHDPRLIHVDGVATLISHGDRWCTDDAAYQRWRRFSRWRPAQFLFGLTPPGLRRRVADRARRASAAHQRRTTDDIMDVNEDAVRGAFATHGVQRIVHGHTHRPAEHRYEIGGRTCERIVLADWRDARCEALAVDGRATRRVALD